MVLYFHDYSRVRTSFIGNLVIDQVEINSLGVPQITNVGRSGANSRDNLSENERIE